MFKLKPLLPILAACTMAAAALTLPAAPAVASSIPDYPFVHVTGSNFRVEMPDIATLDFQVVAADADPAAARAVIDARMAEVRELMQKLSIEEDDMQVREVRQSVRKERNADGTPVYELSCDVHIRLRNTANWPALGGGLLGKPNLDSFAADFDLSTMEQVNDEMVAAAIADARRRAEVMAAAGGRRLGPMMAATPDALKKLGTTLGLERDEFRVERRARATSNQRAADIDRETFVMVQLLKLRQSVDIVFRLENGAAARARPANKP
ncbi:SIMPL domain-containing protein [Massilia sp. 2TAF26]|uniref:SIMPL domain-containing protein n=1 Tax=Massilia sp. 2TAF26 TaxID=3233012 RepID=UPI003F990F92